ncbi:hypothetical protein [Sphingomonas sp. Leaf62]|nr:hypothetical protein [Sphingomonas sp. Leaf62]
MVSEAPKLVREGECENEDGDELYFSDFLDGDQGECPLRYEVEVSD